MEEHDIEVDRIVHWTDSTTVLQWLDASNNKQPVFVAILVTAIIENATIDQWRHVEGKLNPADIGTRGMTVEAPKESEWITGPAWLTETEDAWPKAPEKLQFSIQEEQEPVMGHRSCCNGTRIRTRKIRVFQEIYSSAVIRP